MCRQPFETVSLVVMDPRREFHSAEIFVVNVVGLPDHISETGLGTHVCTRSTRFSLDTVPLILYLPKVNDTIVYGMASSIRVKAVRSLPPAPLSQTHAE